MSRLPALTRALLGLLLLVPATTQAVDTTWTGGSGNWNTGANWSHGLPITSSTAVLNNGSTLSTPTEAGGDYRELWVGTVAGEGGAINVNGGLLTGTNGVLGYAEGGQGSATVTSGTWRNSNNLVVGRSGTGKLEVNGGTVFNNMGYVGHGPSGHGSVTVTSGTWRNSYNLYVGFSGTGKLEINGGTVSSAYGFLGADSNSHGSMTVTSGTWSNSNSFQVGSSGTGTLEVNGGTVTTLLAYLGGDENSHGSATVTSGTWKSSRELYVGYYGTGKLEVNGGLVSTSGTTVVGAYTSGDGTLTLTGNEAQRGVLETWALAKGYNVSNIGTAKVHLDGGILRALRNEIDFIVRFGEGDVTVEEGGAYVDTNGFAIGINAPLGGTGALHKIGAGTLTLGGGNSYSGGTVVEAGTLTAAHHQALGTGDVRVESGAVLTIQSGITVGNAIHLEGGSLQRAVADGASLAGALQASTTLGGVTSAQLLDGVASAPTTLQARFSATTAATNDDNRHGGVLSLSGVHVLDEGTGETDRFVLQLAVASITDDYFLAWLDPETDQWVNAVLGNVEGQAIFAGNRAYTEADFANLGTWGFDTANGTVWAVLNHNSDFAVVPEPGTWALLGLGAVAAFLRRRGRNREG